MSGEQIFPPAVRNLIRQGLVAQGIPAQHVDEIADLGVHAAEEARRALLHVLDRASSTGIYTTALGTAISVAIADLNFLRDAMVEAATEAGLPVKNFTVQTGSVQ